MTKLWSMLPALAATAAVSIGAAPAESPPAAVPDLVSPLVVVAATPGPPWWKVTRGEAVLWILGTPPAISGPPVPLKWNTTVLRRRLTGAKAFLAPVMLPTSVWDEPASPITILADCSALPPKIRANVNPNDLSTYCAGSGDKGYRRIVTPDSAPAGYRVGDLDEMTLAQLKAATQRYNAGPFHAEPPQKGWSLGYATSQLTQGLSVQAFLSPTALVDQLADAARAARLTPKTLALDLGPARQAYKIGSPEAQRACLAEVIAQVQAGSAPITRALEAWARGDLPDSFARIGCLEDKLALYQTVAKATTPALEGLMAQGGKSVAAVELVPLLMRGGVIQALEADGYKVEGPDLDTGTN
ncbi:MAG: hypothetical protein JWM33_2123 [Caulobacteraceae bacterium]|nr:hypothetical protein [Caulobacteraceae bacterium]